MDCTHSALVTDRTGKLRYSNEHNEHMTPTPKHHIPEWNRASRSRYEAVLRLLDERTPEARAAYTRALGDFQALDREIERDPGPSQGPLLRLTSGVEVPSGELAAT